MNEEVIGLIMVREHARVVGPIPSRSHAGDFYGIGETCYSYYPEKNVRITRTCNKYPNCFCYLNTFTHLIYCKTNQAKSLGIAQMNRML